MTGLELAAAADVMPTNMMIEHSPDPINALNRTPNPISLTVSPA